MVDPYIQYHTSWNKRTVTVYSYRAHFMDFAQGSKETSSLITGRRVMPSGTSENPHLNEYDSVCADCSFTGPIMCMSDAGNEMYCFPCLVNSVPSRWPHGVMLHWFSQPFLCLDLVTCLLVETWRLSWRLQQLYYAATGEKNTGVGAPEPTWINQLLFNGSTV